MKQFGTGPGTKLFSFLALLARHLTKVYILSKHNSKIGTSQVPTDKNLVANSNLKLLQELQEHNQVQSGLG